jgi:hypothetical protein
MLAPVLALALTIQPPSFGNNIDGTVSPEDFQWIHMCHASDSPIGVMIYSDNDIEVDLDTGVMTIRDVYTPDGYFREEFILRGYGWNCVSSRRENAEFHPPEND